MKLVQTLYCSNLSELKHACFGWAKPCYHWIGWGLSSLQLNKLYPNTTILYCNNRTNEFIQKLQLPYFKVDDCLKKLNLADSRLWAFPKLNTYSQQKEPFLHLDGDVFLFKKFDEKLFSSGLIAQNEEIATEYYASTQEQLMLHFNWFPDCVTEDFNKPEPIRAVNAGIIGGTDIDFFQEYTKEAFKYVEQNLINLSKINADRFNVFFEQHLFFSLAKKKAKQISFLFPDIVNDNQYQHLGEFHEVPCSKSYLHLLGQYKKDETTCLQMAAKLQELHPDYYERVIKLCHENGMYYPHQKLYQHYFFAGESLFDLRTSSVNAYSQMEINSSHLSDYITCDLPCTKVLHEFINKEKGEALEEISFQELIEDLEKFKSELSKTLLSRQVKPEYLYGRDLESQEWYCNLFSSVDNSKSKCIMRCKDNFIVESGYDWARLYNSLYRVGVTHYENVVLGKDVYYNLIVQEANDYIVSLYDLDEMEKLILEYVETPRSISSVVKEMEQYIEDDVLYEHYDTFKTMVLSFIQQLVVKKAIMPHG